MSWNIHDSNYDRDLRWRYGTTAIESQIPIGTWFGEYKCRFHGFEIFPDGTLKCTFCDFEPNKGYIAAALNAVEHAKDILERYPKMSQRD